MKRKLASFLAQAIAYATLALAFFFIFFRSQL